MKSKVIKEFIDKDTQKIVKPGKVIDISKERFKEINGTAHGVFVEVYIDEVEPKKETKKETKKDDKENLKEIKEEAIKEASKEVTIADTKPTVPKIKK